MEIREVIKSVHIKFKSKAFQHTDYESDLFNDIYPLDKPQRYSGSLIFRHTYPQLSNGFFKKHITNFYISNLLSNTALNETINIVKQLPDLATIQIVAVNIEYLQKFLKTIKEERLNIKHITLPINCQNVVEINAEAEIEFKFINYHEYISKIFRVNLVHPIVNSSNQENDQEAESETEISDTAEEYIENDSDIFIAKNGLNSNFINNIGERTSYKMSEVGKVLKGTKPQVRTNLIDWSYNFYSQTFQQLVVEPAYYQPILINNLSSNDIEVFSEASDDANYCQFSQYICAGQRCRLLSASPEDQFMGILEEDSSDIGIIDVKSNEIQIARGNDDFYYAITNQDCLIKYVIKYPKILTDQQLNKDDPIKQIIDDYRDPKKGYKKISKDNQLIPEIAEFKSVEAWLENLFQRRGGSCRHRAMAVWGKLLATPDIDKSRFRVTHIDNNHIVIEIQNFDGRWYKADVGGSNARLVYFPKEEDSDSSSREAHKFTGHKYRSCDKYFDQSENNSKAKLMLKNFKAVLEPGVEIISSNDFLKHSLFSSNKKILFYISSNDLAAHSNFLLSEATIIKRPVFYIDNLNKTDLDASTIFIDKKGNPKIRTGGLLTDFLNSKIEDNNPPLLIINWDKFDERQKLTLNSLIDLQRTISGRKIDNKIQIISLTSQKITDPSFLSRHNVFIKSNLSHDSLYISEEDFNPNQEVTEIDLQGFTNWRRTLFGKIIFDKNKMVWQPGPLILALREGKTKFNIVNIAADKLVELQYEINQAIACGHMFYQGYDIKLPQGFKIQFNQRNNFNFSKFQAKNITIAANQKFPYYNPSTLQDLHLINAYLFDQLLYGKKIDNGLYLVLPGLLEQHLQFSPELALKLFISSPEITHSQWYCLFYQARQKGVKLELYLAPDVFVPSDLQYTKLLSLLESLENDLVLKPEIFITNNPDLIEVKSQGGQEIIFINIEDYSYQDLFGAIDYEIENDQFKNFKEIPGPVLKELNKGNKVVLRGAFSQELLWEIEQIIAKQPSIHNIQNLVLVIEEQTTLEGSFYKPLKWLPNSAYTIKTFANITKPPAPKYYEQLDSSTDLDGNSKAKAEQFINSRKEKFSELLQNSSMLQLVGCSGVGKSRFIKSLETQGESRFKIYRELTKIKKWANHQSHSEDVILFIDESNIEDIHLTMFEPLKNGRNRKILYKGEFYNLSPHHKVVFAHNDKNYGGGRVEQKLFIDQSIPEMHLTDFPISYIYEQILKTGINNYEQILKSSIYPGLSNEVKQEITEKAFKTECENLIKKYQEANRNSNPRKHLTVRELQEQILVWLSNFYDKTSKYPELKNPNFISTEATSEAEKALSNFFSIRQKQKTGLFDLSGIGLGGVLLEGASGIGKSEMILAILKQQNLHELSLGPESASYKSADGYYKVGANMPFNKKRSIIIKAFEEGKIVWIDEINSCIDDGLEKILNSILTDEHPDKANFKPLPGFGLIASANFIDIEGRANLSPAIRHRMMQPKMKELKEYSEQDLIKIISHWLEIDRFKSESPNYPIVQKNSVAQMIARDFKKIIEAPSNKHFNLRMLRENILEKMLEEYNNIEISNPSSSMRSTTARQSINLCIPQLSS
jgi:hypothetical protein